MKNVYSLAFYRHHRSAYEDPNCGEAQGRYFVNYLATVIRAFHLVYPDWELRIHHDDRVKEYPYWRALVKMDAAGLLRLVDFGVSDSLCGIRGMMSRWRPVFDDDVRFVAMRDVDSLPQPRERVMLEDFMSSGAVIHGILDSQSHSGPLMGGMVAVDAQQFKKRTEHKTLESLMKAGEPLNLDYNVHGSDQRFLNGAVYPYLGPFTYIHAKRNLGYTAMVTRPVAPQVHPLDFVAHCGGAFSVDQAAEILAAHPPKNLALIEECER